MAGRRPVVGRSSAGRPAGRPGLSGTKTISAQAGAGTGAELGKKISELWSQVHPPLKKEFVGSVLSPAMITDLLITKPPFGEYLDIFSKRMFYNQSLTRYHASDDEVMKSPPN